ncbi:MAG: hypothetical protein LBQ87_03355 [Candidatus Fibromonas sp.]|jgi:uncharacterized protein (TIGR02145 family)|nr:hypothetical protein [Candidatus Fibromonas sp.]
MPLLNSRIIIFATISLAFYAYSSDSTLSYGGKTYKTVKIGKQTWMAENLNYETEGSVCYGEGGEVIISGSPRLEPMATKTLTDKEVQANCAKYGRLYDWPTAKKICPKGWHLPSNAEWSELYLFVDGEKDSKNYYRSSEAGRHLKATGGWHFDEKYYGYGNGTDGYGFSALPGGMGHLEGGFYNGGYVGYWWNSNAYLQYISCSDESAGWRYIMMFTLNSVRCLKD